MYWQRAMPSGFFVLLRYYLRVDDVLIRINDTRLYYEKEKDYILREYTSRESKAKDLKVNCPFDDLKTSSPTLNKTVD